MYKTLGCVFVDPTYCRRFSKDLPEFANRKVGGRPILEWVARRCTEAQRLGKVVVVVGGKESNIETPISIPHGVEAVFSDKPDRLGRLRDVLSQHPSDSVVCLSVNTPLIDPTLIDRLITSVENGIADYACFCSRSNSPIHSKLGLVAEWCRRSAIEMADSLLTDLDRRNRFTNFIIGNPDRFSLKFVRIPAVLDRDDLSFQVESQEDWAQVEQIIEALGDDRLDWQQIARLLHH